MVLRTSARAAAPSFPQPFMERSSVFRVTLDSREGEKSTGIKVHLSLPASRLRTQGSLERGRCQISADLPAALSLKNTFLLVLVIPYSIIKLLS